MSGQDLCVCGHIRLHHIHEEGACRPGFRCQKSCEQFDPYVLTEETFLAELTKAEEANIHGRGCQVCTALESMPDSVKPGVLRALSGTIGQEKLALILTKNGYPTGWRAVANHRREDHQS